MIMVAAAMALWAVRMLRLDVIAKAAGSVGLAAAVLTVGWLIHGGGGFGLIPATVATGVFAAWSMLTAACLLRGASEATP
jgi:lipid-binding SYLF domain-containing protein